MELENVARRPLKELEAQELSKVEELQETLAEDSEPGQHGRGKRVAEDLQVGVPVTKRMKKAVKKMGLQVEPSREGGVDDAALYEGDRETVVNDDGMDFDEIVEEEVRGGFDLEAMESGDMSNFENRNLDDQIGFEQGNFGETSSLEMEDSLADDSAIWRETAKRWTSEVLKALPLRKIQTQ